jgi:hypothetical protein
MTSVPPPGFQGTMSFAVLQENSAAWAAGRMPAAVAATKAITGTASRSKAVFMISS